MVEKGLDIDGRGGNGSLDRAIVAVQPRNLFITDARGRAGCSAPFEDRAKREALFDLVERPVVDKGTLRFIPPDEALRLEPAQGLANRRARYAGPFRQLLFAQLLARSEIAGQNLSANVAICMFRSLRHRCSREGLTCPLCIQ